MRKFLLDSVNRILSCSRIITECTKLSLDLLQRPLESTESCGAIINRHWIRALLAYQQCKNHQCNIFSIKCVWVCSKLKIQNTKQLYPLQNESKGPVSQPRPFSFLSFLFYQTATASSVEWNLFGKQFLRITRTILALFSYECICLKVIPSSLDFTNDGKALRSEDSFLLYCYTGNVIYSFPIISYFNVIAFFLWRHLFLFISR